MTVKELKKGDFFKLTPTAKRVYIRGEYDRTEKKYECTAWDDCNAWRYFPGKKEVYTDFTF